MADNEHPPRVHRSRVGTYHPMPGDEMAWSVQDTRGYIDGGPACTDCEKCECDHITCGANCHGDCKEDCGCVQECVGLSFAYVCEDSLETLCPDCWNKVGGVEMECDCP